MEEKKCSQCGLIKPVSDFYKTSSGYRAECKACKRKSKAAYVKNNPNKIKKSSKEYYESNREDRLKYQKKYDEKIKGTKRSF